jgi:hypothetical protein
MQHDEFSKDNHSTTIKSENKRLLNLLLNLLLTRIPEDFA